MTCPDGVVHPLRASPKGRCGANVVRISFSGAGYAGVVGTMCRMAVSTGSSTVAVEESREMTLDRCVIGERRIDVSAHHLHEQRAE